MRQGEFWRAIPAYRDIDEATFLDHIWQGSNSVKTPEELLETIKDLVSRSFVDDAREGFERAPMAVRVSPYMMRFDRLDRSVQRPDPPAVHPARLEAAGPITRA